MLNRKPMLTPTLPASVLMLLIILLPYYQNWPLLRVMAAWKTWAGK